MGCVPVLLYYGGKWENAFSYVDYSIRGIFLPSDCSYGTLLSLVTPQLGKDSGHFEIIMQCQLFKQSPPIQICDDVSVKFYLEMKREDSYKRSYPICVDVDDCYTESYINQADSMLESDFNEYTREQDSSIFNMNQVNQSVEDMGKELAEHVNLENNLTEDNYPIISKPTSGDIRKGDVFRNKHLIVTSVSLFAIKNQFQFIVVKFDTKFYWLKCMEDGCKWTFKSSRTGADGNFKVRNMCNMHSCSRDSVICDHKQATSFVIANCIKHKFLSSKRIYTAGDIREDIHHMYGVDISYDKAWRARDLAIKMIRGDAADSYGNLPAYMHTLAVANPGSYTRIETDSEGRFMFSFVALGASIAGWVRCKPVIVVDGTFLTGRYGGTLFTACTQDANNNIYILAFGVGDSENNNAWDWFLLKLKEAFGDRDELCIVSDRHGSIAHAVERVFPNALREPFP